MDRIAALRTVEEALAAFEAGDADLAAVERRVRGVLRTYATEFEGDLAAYRASGDERVAGMIVLASGVGEARERVRSLAPDGADSLTFEITRVDDLRERSPE